MDAVLDKQTVIFVIIILVCTKGINLSFVSLCCVYFTRLMDVWRTKEKPLSNECKSDAFMQRLILLPSIITQAA